ncbi:hypothetical protein B7463_g1503, partial [Scytalidium lignicola]
MANIEKAKDIQEEHRATPTSPGPELEKRFAVDTVHSDEAMTVLANYDGAIFGIREDLELTGNRYSMASSIFYLGFIGGAYPASQLAQRYPIERVAAGLVLVWGICLLSTAACQSWQGLYAQRLFLGFLEAGVSPIFMLIVGQFYRKDEQALMMGVWYSASGAHNWFFGAMEIYVYRRRSHGYTIGLCHLFFLPPDPIRAKGFDERERYIAVARLRVNNSGVRNKHFKKQQIFELLVDEKFWLVLVMGYLSMIAAAPVNSFVPIIVAGFGFNTLNTLLLLSPAGIVAGSLILGETYMPYKFPRMRTYVIFVCELTTIFAALLLWLLPRSALGGLLFGCYILCGFSGGWGILMGLSIANAAGYTKRAASLSGIYIGYCLVQFTGPSLFQSQDAPRYKPGFMAVVITSAVSALLSVVYRLVCIWDNKHRDKVGTVEAFEHAYEDDVTDKKV